jgi:predicted nucleic acid-binding protein
LTKFLIDASALYPLILRLRENVLLHSNKFAILDLTIYEIGNIIWKEYTRGKIKDPVLVMKMFEEIMRNMKKLSSNQEMLEIFDVAVKNNITFYDASYIYVARKHELKLVTEDADLLKFPESISLGVILKELNLN